MSDRTRFAVIDAYRTMLTVGGSIAAGVLLLVFAYFIESSHPFWAFLLLQVGGLTIFAAGYTALSDHFIRKNFEQQVEAAIDYVRLDQSIKDAGLLRIKQPFSSEELESTMRESSSVLMLILRSDGFFSSAYERLRHRIQEGNLQKLTVVLPNPCNIELMTLMSVKFSDYKQPKELAESIRRVINIWLRQEIYNRLSPERQAALQVLLIDKYPVYSAYIFDRRELWYIPYHYRDNHQPIPNYIFGTGFERTEVYRDLMVMKDEARRHDLTNELSLPPFRVPRVS